MFDLNSLFFLFLILCAAGVGLAVLLPRHPNRVVLAWIGSLSSLTILLVSGKVLLSGQVWQLELWNIRSLGPMILRMDRLGGLIRVHQRLGFSARLHLLGPIHESEEVCEELQSKIIRYLLSSPPGLNCPAAGSRRCALVSAHLGGDVNILLFTGELRTRKRRDHQVGLPHAEFG